MDHIKIVATIGPVSSNPKALKQFAEAGMNVVRLNGSHNTLDWHRETIALIRRELCSMPILMDIPGRKIRTLTLNQEPAFDVGDKIILTSDVKTKDTNRVPVNYEFLHEDVSIGDTIMADDGTLRFLVLSVSGRDIICRAETAGKLRSRKGINLPGISLRTPLVTPQDQKLMEFLTENEVDFAGISFVESKEHVDKIRALKTKEWPRIVAKIENRGGLTCMDEIVEASDAIMIDRGDLSVETGIESVALLQKQILSTGKKYCTPVIVATEMLHTMIDNPFPTKAEISDISNAVIDGAAATMLSGETAIGSHPVTAIQTMRSITKAATDFLDGERAEKTLSDQYGDIDWQRPMAQAVALLCAELPISKVVAVTRLGFAAQVISSQDIAQPIIAVSDDRNAARSFNLFPGTTGVFIDVAFQKESADHIIDCLNHLWKNKYIDDKDVVLNDNLR